MQVKQLTVGHTHNPTRTLRSVYIIYEYIHTVYTYVQPVVHTREPIHLSWQDCEILSRASTLLAGGAEEQGRMCSGCISNLIQYFIRNLSPVPWSLAAFHCIRLHFFIPPLQTAITRLLAGNKRSSMMPFVYFYEPFVLIIHFLRAFRSVARCATLGN